MFAGCEIPWLNFCSIESNLTLNTGAALAVWFLTGIICSISTSLAKPFLNRKGIIDSHGVLSTYLIPGAIAGLLSTIFQANGYSNNFTTNYRGDYDKANNAY